LIPTAIQLPLEAKFVSFGASSTMPHDIEATLFYYKSRGGISPETNDIELLLGDKDADGRKVTIQDIREKEHDYSLENNGFQILNHDMRGDIFEDVETIKSLYYPAMADLLKRRFLAYICRYFINELTEDGVVQAPKT
jgi:hypothetical protein